MLDGHHSHLIVEWVGYSKVKKAMVVNNRDRVHMWKIEERTKQAPQIKVEGDTDGSPETTQQAPRMNLKWKVTQG